VPRLAPLGEEAGQVYLSGTLDPGGALLLRANAARLPISSESLLGDPALEWLRAFAPRGVLELDAWAEVPSDGRAPHGRVRAAVQRGALQLAGGVHRLEAVALDLDARWQPDKPRDWRDPRTWHALARANGEWNGSRFELTGLLGDEAGGSDVAVCWVHAAAFPLERALVTSIDPGGVGERVWDGLEPRGQSELWAAVRVPRRAGEQADELRAEGLALLEPRGGLGLTYRGMGRDATGAFEEGFPLPMEGISGELAVALASSAMRPWRVALHGLAGSSGPTSVSARGSVRAHPRDAPATSASYELAELDLEIEGEGLPIDEPVREALRGLKGPLPPGETWGLFQPDGGVGSLRLALWRTVDMPWVATDLALDLERVSLAWNEVPVPISEARGRLTFRSDGRRELALAVDVEGRARTAQRLGARVRLRTQSEPLERGGWQDLDELSHVRVDVERLSLTGDDRRILSESLEGVGGPLAELSPRGFADVVFERVGWDREQEPVLRAEVVPLAPAQLVPRAFPLTIDEVRGRVTVSEGPYGVQVRMAPLLGTLRGGVDVALSAEMPGLLRVHAAGVDPSDPSLVGALGALFGAGEDGSSAGLQTGALQLTGRLEVIGELPLHEEREPGRWRILLRDSSLSIPTGFRLDALRGELGYSQGALSGRGLGARLARTPLALRELAFRTQEQGSTLSARFDAADVPVDREHLAGFVSPETLDPLLDELGWTGRFNFSDGRLELELPAQGETRLELSGTLTPRAMEIRLGLPMEIDSASVRLERLVLEGGRVRALVGIEGLNGRLAGRALADARLLVTYHHPTLSIESLEATLEGGRMRSLGAGAERAGTAFSIALQEPFPFGLALDLRGVEVAGLLRGLFPSGVATRGRSEAQLLLSGDLERLLDIRGTGWARVSDSRLWSVPVFRALFGQLGLDATATFDSMYANLAISDGVVRMSDIVLRSPLLQLVGTGSLDFDGALHHDLELRYELVDNLGPFTRLIYWLQNELLSVSIRGDMEQPIVVLQNPFRRMFGGGEGYRPLPTPGYAPWPPRY
jgi:hypothetical protein